MSFCIAVTLASSAVRRLSNSVSFEDIKKKLEVV
jgi:hypothetical protein